MLKPNISQGQWPTKIPSLRCVRRVFVAVTHGGGLSGRPSDLSFRCLSALVRVDFTMSSCVIFNSGCCWMYSRIVSWKIAKKFSQLKIIFFCHLRQPHTDSCLTSYCFCCSSDLVIHLSLFLSESCVHCLPRLSLMSLVVAWVRHRKS